MNIQLFSLFFFFNAFFGVCIETGRMCTYFLWGVISTDDPETRRNLDNAGGVLQFVSSPFTCTAYLIVLGMWFKFYIIVSNLRRTTAINATSNASVPDMFKKSDKLKKRDFVLPSCLMIGLIQIVICTTVAILLGVSQSSPPVDDSGARREKADYYLGIETIIGVVVYAIITLGFLVYIMLLLSLFRMRFYNKNARSIVCHVIALSGLCCACFLFRIFVMINPPSEESLTNDILQYAYYIVCEVIPQFLLLLLHAKRVSAASTTQKSSRGMWAGA